MKLSKLSNQFKEKKFSAILSSLLVGIVVVIFGFMFLNCGAGPQLKTLDPNAGAYAITFTGLIGVGESKYVSVGQIPLVSSTPTPYTVNNFTVEAWIKMPVSATSGPIFSRGITGQEKFTLYIYNNVPRFSASSSVVAATTTNVNDNQWHHIAGVFSYAGHDHTPNPDCLSTHIDIYVDGVFKNCTNLTQGYPSDIDCGAACTNRIGYDATLIIDGGLSVFNGVIDEVRIWKEARNSGLENWLTPGTDFITVWWDKEITAENWTQVDPNDALIGYWKFNEGTGSSATDSSGEGHTGSKILCAQDCIGTPITTPWLDGWVSGKTF